MDDKDYLNLVRAWKNNTVYLTQRKGINILKRYISIMIKWYCEKISEVYTSSLNKDIFK